MLAGMTLALGSSLALAAEQLTILWAEWDPANYLQELVKEYEKQTGVKVKVETVPWPDFQTKAFREFAAKGDAYDMVVGDSQWLGAGSTGGHYVDLTEFFKKNNVGKVMAPATVAGYAEYPPKSGRFWAIPLEGDANG
jgi:multiple sugar transport system substrate-binding protein